MTDEDIISRLRPWQVLPFNNLLAAVRRYRSALDCSDTGTGKTYVACAVARKLQLPTLVVCPKIAQTAWKQVAAHFDDTLSVINYEQLRTGNTLFGHWNNPLPSPPPPPNYSCVCCQQKVDIEKPVPCYAHHAGIHCIESHKYEHNYGAFHFAPQVAVLIFDEVHRCSGRDSLNAELLIGAKRANKIILGLTATPAIGPLQMRALGYVLGLHTLTPRLGLGFYEWLRTVGCGKIPGLQGFRWTVGAERQASIMRTLHAAIFPERGVRVRTSEIPNFPTRTIISECYDIEDPERIDSLYASMRDSLARWKAVADTDAAPDSPLTSILRARQRLEILKVPLSLELCADYLDKGCSVAIFCNFSETIDALAARLKTDCIIDGRPQHNKRGMRDACVARFQSNSARVILVNNQAGGICIGLQDLTGEFPRAGLVFPDFSADKMRQVFGRLPRDGGKSHSVYRVLFAAGSVEGGVARALRTKSDNLDALTDADMQPANFVLTKGQY